MRSVKCSYPRVKSYMFAFVKDNLHIIKQLSGEKIVPLDLSDSFTWSFPEFVPFCSHLYYYSSYKDFNTALLAR